MSEELQHEAEDTIKQMETKLNAAKDQNRDWGKTIAIVFPDIETAYTIKFAMDGTVTTAKMPASEARLGEIATLAIGPVEDVKDCVDGRMSPADSFSCGILKVEGSFEALQKLAPCFPVTGMSI